MCGLNGKLNGKQNEYAAIARYSEILTAFIPSPFKLRSP
jgi:hypothetical protein